MKTLANGIAYAVGAVVCVLLIATCVIVFAEVVSRYLSIGSLAWSDEAARFLFVWTALLGAALGVKDGSHFAIHFVSDIMPAPMRAALVVFGAIGTSLVYGVMVWQGARLVVQNGEQLSPALDMSMSVPYLVVPVSGALMLFFTWVNVIEQWQRPGRQPPLLDPSSLPNIVE
jgi:TRAP-type C4-dicarboxylate transport system permease small subunit